MAPGTPISITALPLPAYVKEFYAKFAHLTPIQQKAVSAGLLEGKSLLVCAPTASGKTLVATMAITSALAQGGKALYVVPLKALASEKYKEYQQLFEHSTYKVILSTGEVDSQSDYLARYDVLILTTEKLDSLLRHRVSWLGTVKTVVIDEIHLLNDPGRGPTVEIILTLLKILLQPQLIALSATIGNPKELASWLQAELVQDSWRPVELKQGIRQGERIEFY